jgi:fructokinase
MGELLGGIEAGGTKFVCVAGTGPDDIIDRRRLDTRTPAEVIPDVLDFFGGHPGVAAIGIASFGPLELRPGHPLYGHITATPKPGWTNADLVGPVSALGVPVGIETDVVGAAIGEWRWGAGRGLDNLVYVTVGTGIGGGQVVRGKAVPGLIHSEMGHITVQRHPQDGFPGVCPFHGDCLEGMASGPAILARWGRPGHDLGPLAERAVAMEAHYLASGFRSIVYAVAPQRIILGGGVSELPGLLEAVRRSLLEQLNGYAVLAEHEADFVVAPGLGGDAGVAGALAIAEQALGLDE